MKRLVIAVLTGMIGAAGLRCEAEAACARVTVVPSVAASRGPLTLADLLAHGSCREWLRAAAKVSLGVAPQPGSVRVLDGAQVEGLLQGLAAGSMNLEKKFALQIPSRIVVRLAGAAKTCEEIARFVAGAAPAEEKASLSGGGQNALGCGSAVEIREDASLRLGKTEWNPALRRWEFFLSCVRAEECVPFLVWAYPDPTHGDRTLAEKTRAVSVPAAHGARGARLAASGSFSGSGPGAMVARLIKPGQTAVLIWDEAGIRIVLPVTCLDAGGIGEFVRVQFKNTPRILRAEVLGDGTLRAAL